MQKTIYSLLTLFILVFNACKNNKTTVKETTTNVAESKAFHVTTEILTPTNFKHYIDLYGTVESENVYNVTSKSVGGQVKEIFIIKGDVVKIGQKLLQLDNSYLRKTLAAIEQNILSVQSQLNFANTLYEKQKNLFNEKIGSEVQLITAKNNVDNLENQIKVLEQQIAVTKEQLSFTTVFSEVEGVVEELNVKVGENFVGAPNQIKIVNNNKLKIKALVPENYLSNVKLNATMIVSLPNSNINFTTKISLIGKIIDPLSRSFFVEAKLPTSNSFKPNQLLQIKILDMDIQNAFSVPVNILQKDEKDNFIYIAVNNDGKLIAKKQVVKPSVIYGNLILITEGLSNQMQIITTGYQNLYDGQLITTK